MPAGEAQVAPMERQSRESRGHVLPHGTRGRPPSKSSTAWKRLSCPLAPNDNMQVVYPSTGPRCSTCSVARSGPQLRKPLVIMRPPSIARTPTGTIDELRQRTDYAKVIDDPAGAPAQDKDARASLLCSGTV